MPAGKDGWKETQQMCFCHGPDPPDLDLSAVEPGVRSDQDTSTVSGSVGERDHHRRSVVAGVQPARWIVAPDLDLHYHWFEAEKRRHKAGQVAATPAQGARKQVGAPRDFDIETHPTYTTEVARGRLGNICGRRSSRRSEG